MSYEESIDLDAKHYRQYSSCQQGLVQELSDFRHLNESDRVLDVGCGDGRITSQIARRVIKGKVIGIDLSEAMVHLAQSSFPFEKYPNLEFFVENVEELCFPDDSFHSIFSFNCLHWVRKGKKALSQMTRCLEPGGCITILTFPKESPYYLFLEETLESDPCMKGGFAQLSAYKTMLYSQEYKGILENLGIKVHGFQLQDRIATYGSKAALMEYIKGWLVCFVPIPHSEQDIFLQKAANRSLRYAIDCGDGKIHLPYQVLTIKGQKL